MKIQWHYLILAGLLLAAISAAGCTSEQPTGPPPEVASPVLPGQIMYQVGDVTGDGIAGGTIDTVTFTVGLADKEKSVNFDNVSIFYADAVHSDTLVPVAGFRGEPTPGTYGIVGVQNEVGKPNNRLEFEERFVIKINPRTPIVPRSIITVIVKPPTGTPLTIRRLAPPDILKENNLFKPL